jgi:hypothetical protein
MLTKLSMSTSLVLHNKCRAHAEAGRGGSTAGDGNGGKRHHIARNGSQEDNRDNHKGLHRVLSVVG